MSLIVHAPVGAGRLLKAQIAAQYTGVELKFVPDFKMRETNKSPAFLAKFPLGKVPAVETPYGPLTESGAIARYVARVRPDAGLMGGSFYQQALVDQWIDFAVTEIEATAGPNWIYPVWGYGDFNQKKYEEAKATTSTLLSYVDTHLIDNTFLTGDNITLGDISLWTALRQLFTNVLPEAVVSAQWPSVLRWFQTLLAQKQFAAVTSVEWVTAEKYAKGNPLAGAVEEKKEEKKAEAAPAPAPAPAPVVAAKAVEAVAPVAVKEVAKPVEAPKEVVKEVAVETPKESAAPAPKAEEAKKGKGGKGKKEAKAEEPKPVEATPAPVEAKAAAVVEEPKPVEAAAPKAEEGKKGKGGKGKQEAKKEAKAAPAEEPKPAPVEVKAVETAAPTTAAAVPPSPKSAKKGKQEAKKETPAAAPVAAAAAPKAESPKTPKAKAEPKVEAPKTPKGKAEAKAETPKSAKKGKGK